MPSNYGMVGGGRGALIGKVHRTPSALNGDCRLAAGAFSSLAVKNLASGRELGVDRDRICASYSEIAREEAGWKDGIDSVVSVTPNHQHRSAARACLEERIRVVCGMPVWDGYVATVVADAFVQSATTGQPQAVSDLERPAMYEC